MIQLEKRGLNYVLAFTTFEYTRGYRRASMLGDFSMPRKWNWKRQAEVCSSARGGQHMKKHLPTFKCGHYLSG